MKSKIVTWVLHSAKFLVAVRKSARAGPLSDIVLTAPWGSVVMDLQAGHLASWVLTLELKSFSVSANIQISGVMDLADWPFDPAIPLPL